MAHANQSLWARYGELYVYDGIYDASALVNDYSGNVIEGSTNSKVFIYGGKFKGGESTYKTAGGAGGILSVKGECEITDGEFSGGYASTSDSSKMGVGGIVHVSKTGKLKLHGGTFKGGKADHMGGCFNIEGQMDMDGGEISGCQSKTGNNLYVKANAKVNIKGGHIDGSKENNIVNKGSLNYSDQKFIQ